LPDIVLDYVGLTLTETDRKRWGLPAFPTLSQTRSSSSDAFLFEVREPPSVRKTISWLDQAYSILESACNDLRDKAKADPVKHKKSYHQCRGLLYKVDAVKEGLDAEPDDWYILSGDSAVYQRDKHVPGIIVRPLTASHHFTRLFFSKRLMLMSATVGNPDTLARELGIKSINFREAPNPWPPETRPIYVLPDIPRLNYRSTESEYRQQADVMAKFISEFPPTWDYIIQVTRKSESKALANRLSQSDSNLDDRLWPMPIGDDTEYYATGKQVNLWHNRMKKRPGSICIAWQLWSGYNGVREKGVIIAKTPYGSLGDGFAKARAQHNWNYYHLQTAQRLQQGASRSRRGNNEDYDTGGVVRGAVAIADGNWTKLRKYLSQGFIDSLVEL